MPIPATSKPTINPSASRQPSTATTSSASSSARSQPLPPVQAQASFVNRDYPENCLLFLKHLSPETSKTSLKDMLNALMVQSSSSDSSAVLKGKPEVSYVDWLKGSDSVGVASILNLPFHNSSCDQPCSVPIFLRLTLFVRLSSSSVMSKAHIRIPHPSLSSPILAHFAARTLYHHPASSIASLSSEPAAGGDNQPVEVELVGGERERLYWTGRVKEGLRRKAVEDIARIDGEGLGTAGARPI